MTTEQLISLVMVEVECNCGSEDCLICANRLMINLKGDVYYAAN